MPGAVLGSEARTVNKAGEVSLPPGLPLQDRRPSMNTPPPVTPVTGGMERSASGKGDGLTNRMVTDGFAKKVVLGKTSQVRKMGLDLGMFEGDMTGIQRLKCWG